MPLRLKQSQNFTLNVPDSSNVVVSAREQVVALVAPLNGLDEVVLVRALRHFFITLRYTYVPQLN